MLKKYIHQALVAAIYVVLTLVLGAFSYGSVQIRISEVLLVLALFDPDYIWGLTLGCILANLFGVFTGANTIGIMDVIFGSCATFISVVLIHYFKEVKFKEIPLLSLFMPAIANGIIVGFELAYIFTPNELMKFWVINGLAVAAGEVISVVVLGIPVYLGLKKRLKKNG